MAVNVALFPSHFQYVVIKVTGRQHKVYIQTTVNMALGVVKGALLIEVLSFQGVLIRGFLLYCVLISGGPD